MRWAWPVAGLGLTGQVEGECGPWQCPEGRSLPPSVHVARTMCVQAAVCSHEGKPH